MTYYLITREFVGPYCDRRVDFDHAVISTEPERYNMSRSVCTDGWCGTTNDVSVTAHGAFETLEEAKQALAALDEYAEHRTVDYDGPDLETVYVAKPGKYATMTRDAVSMIYPDDYLADYIRSEMTDGDIDALVDYWDEISAGHTGERLGSNRHVLTRRMREMRDGLKSE